ncbi:hypothetical protein QZH41_016889 [Actinostola sp. cb2023]|nr:hypothetical protein QZH41_016889 [Actinostola sp. cb2023]
MNEIIWNNHLITSNKKSLFFKQWYIKGILQYRSKVTYQVSYRLSRYEFIVSRYQFIVSRYEFIVSRYQFIVSRYEFIVSRYQFIVSRYEFIVSRDKFIVSRYDKLASQCLICNVHFCMVTPFYKHYLKANSTFIRFLRSVAYRQIVRFIWNYMGNMRTPLPACIYTAIRKEFPSEHGTYTGFEEEDEEEEEEEEATEEEDLL